MGALSRPPSLAPGVGVVLIIWGLSRLAFYIPALMSFALVPDNFVETARVDVRGQIPLVLHWRWDAIHYYSIATSGYQWESLTSFFPLLPLLIWFVATLLAGGRPPTPMPIAEAERWPLVAGVLVAHAVALLALWLLFQLAQEETGDAATAQRAIIYTAFFPLAFYYAVPYTEGLFLATTVGMFLSARQGHWLRAGLWAAAASATRVLGILAVPALALEIVLAWRRGDLPAGSWARAGLGLLLAPLGLGFYMLYLWWAMGDPLVFARQQQATWRHELLLPPLTLWRGLHYALNPERSVEPWAWMLTVLHLTIVLGFLVVFILSLRRWRSSYVLYGALLVGMVLATPLSGEWLMHSLGRYVMVLFPVYLTLARWGRHPMFHLGVLVLCLPLFGLLTALFARWYPIS